MARCLKARFRAPASAGCAPSPSDKVFDVLPTYGQRCDRRAAAGTQEQHQILRADHVAGCSCFLLYRPIRRAPHLRWPRIAALGNGTWTLAASYPTRSDLSLGLFDEIVEFLAQPVPIRQKRTFPRFESLQDVGRYLSVPLHRAAGRANCSSLGANLEARNGEQLASVRTLKEADGFSDIAPISSATSP